MTIIMSHPDIGLEPVRPPGCPPTGFTCAPLCSRLLCTTLCSRGPDVANYSQDSIFIPSIQTLAFTNRLYKSHLTSHAWYSLKAQHTRACEEVSLTVCCLLLHRLRPAQTGFAETQACVRWFFRQQTAYCGFSTIYPATHTCKESSWRKFRASCRRIRCRGQRM